MSTRQSTVFGSNHIETHSTGGIGLILSLGAAAAMCVFAAVVGALIGGAVALAVTVLGSTLAAVLLLRAGTRTALEVAHWRKYGELPARVPLYVRNPPPAAALEPPQHVTWSATRVYPQEHE